MTTPALDAGDVQQEQPMTDTPSASAQRPMIELSDVTVRYGGNVVALDNTTLRIDKGDFVSPPFSNWSLACWNRPPVLLLSVAVK